MSEPDASDRRRIPRRPILLGPAIALMNRLTYPRKFLLISLLFLVPLALVMYFLVYELTDRIDFTRKETLGTRYLRPLVTLFRHAGELRPMARAYSAGDRDLRPAVVRKLGEIDEDFKTVDAVDRELGASLNTAVKLGPLKENWTSLRREASGPVSRDNDKLLVDFLAEIQGFFGHVGDTSNLILDPDLDTYYLMDSILLKLHEGQALLMRAGFEGVAIANRKTLSAEERAQFIVLLGLIRSNLDETRKGAEVAFRNNPSATARPRLEKFYDDYVEGVRACVDSLNKELVEAKTIAATPESVVVLTARPLEMSFDLWSRASTELDELMQMRIRRFEGRGRIAWTSTLLVLALVGYLWLAFYAAVMGTVSNLEQASQRMLGGDPGHEVVLETQDELGRVTRSFNAIAQRLRREWEQATEENARARAAETRLQESEERTRLIIQSALDAVITIGLEGRIVEWNRQATAIFGWEREEVIGKQLSSIIIPEKYRAAHEAGLKRFAATGEGPVLNKRIEITALRRDGTEFPVELSITPLSAGKGAAFSAFLRDITERKRSEEELKRTKDSAEAANQAKSEFLANMSHELRTPLNSIIGFSTVILKSRGPQLPTQEAAYLERILDNGKHLLGLINTILDLSKIEAGKVDLNVTPVDLGALVRETLAQLEGRVVDKKVTLAADLPSRLALFPTDAEKLKQILINLVGNAIKFTEKGQVTVRVAVHPGTDRPCRIDVIDTGLGIPKDMLGRIFDAFQQADSGMARKYEGTGLGLTISRSLSQLLGYRIEVDSEVGKGSTFSLHLVPIEETRGTTARRVRPASDNEPQQDLKDKLVLVVDDEDDSRILLRQYISDCGCRVVDAATGPEALRKARELRPDLITLDLMMPGMNGWEILRGLKADPDLMDVPVVVVSIVGRENRGTIFGAADLLNKPVSREELCAVLRRNVRPGKSKVLLVDDDESARRVMSEYLSDEQAEIATAGNGQEALDRLTSFTPDLIILDLMMPVMDGMTFLDALRRDPRYASLPVVVATAKDLTIQDVRQLEASVSVVLKKGGDLRADLGRVLRSLLKNRGKAPAAAPSPGNRIPVRVRAVVADMVPGFLEARRQEVQAIRAALERADWEPIRVMGHNMKGVGSSYGFPPITEIGRGLEAAAGAGDRGEILKLTAALADYLERVEVISE
jgi:PAS domain S-box-containing protein